MQRFAQASYALVISSTFAGVLLRIFEHIYLMVVRIAIVVAQIDISSGSRSGAATWRLRELSWLGWF